MSTYTEPLAQIDLHARNVDQAHRDIIQECLEWVPEPHRAAILAELEQIEAEYEGSDMGDSGDYSEALQWLADDAETAVNEHTPYVTGTIAESGTWYVAEPAWWEGLDEWTP